MPERWRNSATAVPAIPPPTISTFITLTLAYASIPAFRGDTLVGLAVFCRRRAGESSEAEVCLLTELARFLGVAIARARDREQIDALRGRLADEAATKLCMGHAPLFRDIVGGSLAIRRTLEAIEINLVAKGERVGQSHALAERMRERLQPPVWQD